MNKRKNNRSITTVVVREINRSWAVELAVQSIVFPLDTAGRQIGLSGSSFMFDLAANFLSVACLLARLFALFLFPFPPSPPLFCVRVYLWDCLVLHRSVASRDEVALTLRALVARKGLAGLYKGFGAYVASVALVTVLGNLWTTLMSQPTRKPSAEHVRDEPGAEPKRRPHLIPSQSSQLAARPAAPTRVRYMWGIRFVDQAEPHHVYNQPHAPLHFDMNHHHHHF
jgi:hypothetical protein